MASYTLDADMGYFPTLEHTRVWYGVPDHIPDEQVERYVEVLRSKAIVIARILVPQ